MHLPALNSGGASCLECSGRQQDKEDLTSRITGVEAWNEHLQSCHPTLFWYFNANRSTFAVSNASTDTETSIVGKKRKRGSVGTQVISSGEIHEADDFDGWREASDDDSDGPQSRPYYITNSPIDYTPSTNDVLLTHPMTTPESMEECSGIDISLIDPLLRDK
jgi:hypothetical protein